MIWVVLALVVGFVLWIVNFMHNRINDLYERIDRLQDTNTNLDAKLSQRIDNLKHSNDEVNPSRYVSEHQLKASLNDIYTTLIVHENFIIKDDVQMRQRFENALKQAKKPYDDDDY